MGSKIAQPDANQIDRQPPKPEPVQLLRGGSTPQLRQKLDAMVRDHAYRLYHDNGENHGNDLSHWKEAEAKFLSSDVKVRESGPWYHCNCPVHGAAAGKIQVAVDPQLLMIHLDRNLSPEGAPQGGNAPIFYCIRWPQEVDPSTAAAYVLDTNLSIEVKKADPPAPNPAVEPVRKPNS
jgi:hypothetical protein